jgi:hypothetical protein
MTEGTKKERYKSYENKLRHNFGKANVSNNSTPTLGIPNGKNIIYSIRSITLVVILIQIRIIIANYGSQIVLNIEAKQMEIESYVHETKFGQNLCV